MKKHALGLALLGMVLALAGCQPGTSAAGGPEKAQKQTSAPAGGSDLEKANTLVTTLSRGQASATQVLDKHGLKAIVVKNNNGSSDLVWASEDFSLFIPQVMPADNQGSDPKLAIMEELGLFLKADDLASQVKKEGFIVGKKGPVVTAFMDPNCIFCNKLYKGLKPFVDQGKIRVRYVMVATLKPSSMPKSVAILAAKDPAKALDQDEMAFDERTEEGGTAGDTSGKHPELEAKIQGYGDLMRKTGSTGTPTVLACTNDAKGAFIFRGYPGDPNTATGLDGFIASLQTDPSVGACK